MDQNAWADLPIRLLTIIVVGPLVLIVVYLGSPASTLVVLGLGLIAAIELHHIIRPSNRFAMISMLTLAFLGTQARYYLLLAATATLLLSGAIEAQFVARRLRRLYFRNYIYLVVAGLYAGVPIGFILLVRDWEQGKLWIYLLLATNWSTDGMAFIGGRMYGRHKLVPQISPGKTLEGSLAGLLAGTVVGVVLAIVFNLPLVRALAASFSIAFFTELGDLVESAIKRYFDVKDTGSLLPGHGGVLDRVDGLLFAAPALYMVLIL